MAPWLRNLLTVIVILTVSPALANPTFTNVTADAGINYMQATEPRTEQDFMSGGAAARDFDGDGYADLLITRLDAHPILYKNLGNGTFEDVSLAAGLGVMATGANGAAWGDIDNDHDPDLYLTSPHDDQPHHLFLNNGNGTFAESAVASGAAIVDTPVTYRYGTSVAFGDYDSDGWLDIHTNEWGQNDRNPPELRSHARLLRNNGANAPGTFVDKTIEAGVSLEDMVGTGPLESPLEYVLSFSSRFTDVDRDGHADLVIASDFGTSRIYWNNGNGTFSNGTASANFGTDENGMGLSVGDYDADGLLDVFVTSIYHSDPPAAGHNENGNWGVSGNRLYRNNGNRTFSDATDAAGVRDGSWGWGTSFFDYDNDGSLDLIMTNGFTSGDFADDRSTLWKNDGSGMFTDVSMAAGITDTDQGRGLLTFDYDNDGDLDVFIANNAAQPILYRNDGGHENNWLKLQLEGTASNRDAIGALVTVSPGGELPPMIREIDGGSNYLSQNDIVAHFGLANHAGVIESVSIRWPDGSMQEILGVLPNQTLQIVQGSSPTQEIVPGDYNNDGSVNAADYTIWRDNLGRSVTLPGDATPGTVTPSDYDLWVANFGSTSGSSLQTDTAVPEPSCAALVFIASVVVWLRRRA